MTVETGAVNALWSMRIGRGKGTTPARVNFSIVASSGSRECQTAENACSSTQAYVTPALGHAIVEGDVATNDRAREWRGQIVAVARRITYLSMLVRLSSQPTTGGFFTILGRDDVLQGYGASGNSCGPEVRFGGSKPVSRPPQVGTPRQPSRKRNLRSLPTVASSRRRHTITACVPSELENRFQTTPFRPSGAWRTRPRTTQCHRRDTIRSS